MSKTVTITVKSKYHDVQIVNMGRHPKKKESSDGYIRVSLPQEIIQQIDQFIKESGGRYRYRNEVIRHAVIEFIQKERKKIFVQNIG